MRNFFSLQLATPLGSLLALPSLLLAQAATSVPGASPVVTDGLKAGASARDIESLDASFEEAISIFHNHIAIFIVAFLVTLFVTPLCRKFAIKYGIIDRPDEVRKLHKFPIAYLGGLAVFIGLLAGIAVSYIGPSIGLIKLHESSKITDIPPVPVFIVVGMTVIMFVGLLDDITDISPWQKVGGQLFAAAMLAYSNVGVKVAAQLLYPIGRMIGNEELTFHIIGPVSFDLIYWSGTIIIAMFVLGACNAANLVDGLDGLLSGVTAITGMGLLVLALALAAADDGVLDHTRLVLCLSLIGACMGFLPHNFNPATIFLGDTGSLLLGYVTIVIILTLGDTGQTHWVLAGLVMFAIPIIDTTLAIVRRKMAGKKLSEGDSDHLHHMFKRAVGVKMTALILYAIGFVFAGLGILMYFERARVTYAFVIVAASFIGVMAIKQARRKQFEEQAAVLAKSGKSADSGSVPKT